MEIYGGRRSDSPYPTNGLDIRAALIQAVAAESSTTKPNWLSFSGSFA